MGIGRGLEGGKTAGEVLNCVYCTKIIYAV